MPGKSASWRHLALLEFLEIWMHYTQFNGQKPWNDACAAAACSNYGFHELLTEKRRKNSRDNWTIWMPDGGRRCFAHLCTESWTLCWYRNHLIAGQSMLQGILDIPWQILTPLCVEGSRASRATAGRPYSHQWTSGPRCQPIVLPPHFADGLKSWKSESLKAELFYGFSLTLQKLSDADPLRLQSDRLMWSSSVERFAKQLIGWSPGPQGAPRHQGEAAMDSVFLPLPWYSVYYHIITITILLAQCTVPVELHQIWCHTATVGHSCQIILASFR